MAAGNCSIKVPMSELTHTLVVSVKLTGVRTFRIRLALGLLLMRLGAMVTGMGCRIDVPGEDEAKGQP